MKIARRIALGVGLALGVVLMASIAVDTTFHHINCPECSGRMTMEPIGKYRYNWHCTKDSCGLLITDNTSWPTPVEDL